MANPEKDIAGEILSSAGLSASRLGLRFDRVVVAVLGQLRSFAETSAPSGVTVLVTLSAPIRLPARTVEGVKEIATRLLAGAGRDQAATVHGNSVRVRLVEHSPSRTPKLIGFVHNPGPAPPVLLDQAERWLREQA